MRKRSADRKPDGVCAKAHFIKINILQEVNFRVAENIVLQMKNIHKSFPGVRALQGVDFTLRKGEVHALMGENGAGKSTLIKVLTGVYSKDEGQISIEGKEVAIHSPQEAQKNGVSTVYQEITLCPNLSVAENMYIGRLENICQNWKKMNTDADKILQSLDIPAKATQQLSTCSLAVQQMVAIARAVDIRQVIQFLAEHLGHQLNPRKLLDLILPYQLAVAHYCDPIADFIHLIQEMSYKDDPHASALQIPHELKQLLHFLFIQ